MVKSAHRGGRALLSLVLALVGLAAFSRADAGTQAYYYDAAGRLTGVVDPVNGTAVYSLDGAGNVLSVTEKPIGTMIVGGFVPATGAAGTSVTIGGNFAAATTSNTTVKFNSVTANVTAVSATKLTVTVPAGATTGPISVTVNASSGGGSYTTGLNFTVPTATAAPTIMSFSPTLVAPGSTVTVHGTNFSTTNSLVYVNNFVMPVNSATSTTLTFTVPPGATTGHITVETPAGKVASSAHLFIPPINLGYGNGGTFSSYQPDLEYPVSQVVQTIEGVLGQASNVNAVPANGDIALIAVDVPANQSIGATLADPTDSSDIYTDFGIYAPNGAIVGSANLTRGSPALVPPDFYTPSPVAATALIVTSPWTASQDTAVITPFVAPAPVTQTIQTNGSSNTVTIGSTGQAAHVQFAGTAGTEVSLLIQPSSGSNPCLVVTVIAPDSYTEIYNSFGTCGNGAIETSLGLSLPQTGTYTINVIYTAGTGYTSPQNGLQGGINYMYPLSFTVQAWVVSPFTGTTSYGAGPVSVDFTTLGQVAQYTFQAMPGDTFSFVTEPNDTDTQQCYAAWLMNPAPDGTASITNGWIGNNILGCGESPVLLAKVPAAGTYGTGAAASGPWTYTMYVVPQTSNVTGLAQFGSFDFAIYNAGTPAKCPGGSAAPCALSNNQTLTVPVTAAGQTVEATFVGNGHTATLTVSGDSGVPCVSATIVSGGSSYACGAAVTPTVATTANQTYQINITSTNQPPSNTSTHFGLGNITITLSE